MLNAYGANIHIDWGMRIEFNIIDPKSNFLDLKTLNIIYVGAIVGLHNLAFLEVIVYNFF